MKAKTAFEVSGNSPTVSENGAEMRAEIIRLHREGLMPTLDELLSAIAETRAEYGPKILAARRARVNHQKS